MNDDKFSSEQGDDGEDNIDHNEPNDIGYKSSSSGTSFYNLCRRKVSVQRLPMKMNSRLLRDMKVTTLLVNQQALSCALFVTRVRIP
ncbi:hypothetical protein Tco_1412281 [Tanacetum coccineum]